MDNISPLEAPSARRNYMLPSHRRDGLIEWMKEILNHSFVLDAPETYVDSFLFFEELVQEHREKGLRSRLCQYVPNIGRFHTPLPLRNAFLKYDTKYAISQRDFISPSFHELRHILNLAQVMAIGKKLSMITFDGDQTLYSDGGNFEPNADLALPIVQLMKSGVKIAVITAAGYGLDGSKYAVRLQGLLQSFVEEGLTQEEIQGFYVFGGECNYLLQAHAVERVSGVITSRVIELRPVPNSVWQNPELNCPKPTEWTPAQVNQVLDIAERIMRETMSTMNLRAKLLRKERAVGIYPGGDDMVAAVPCGHGSKKLKQEALDELVLRVMDALRRASPAIQIPYCVFNGGRDAWIDVGNKSVASRILQAFLKLDTANCLHVGDQFLQSGNDYACRDSSPCIWINSPAETEKILTNILAYKRSEKCVEYERTPCPGGKVTPVRKGLLSRNTSLNGLLVEEELGTPAPPSTDLDSVVAKLSTVTVTPAKAAPTTTTTESTDQQSHGRTLRNPVSSFNVYTGQHE